jgi:hypothetical protein
MNLTAFVVAAVIVLAYYAVSVSRARRNHDRKGTES